MPSAAFGSNDAQTYLQSSPSEIDNGPPYRGYDAAAASRSPVIIGAVAPRAARICYFNRGKERERRGRRRRREERDMM